MFKFRHLISIGLVFALPAIAVAQEEPNIARIIDVGTKDPQVMVWNDYLSNRFGGRYTGSDAYINASDWAVYQFKQWGLKAWKEEVGTMPVGFNRGPWFGKMTKPIEKDLYFGTPSMTAGTKGIQRGHVVIAPERVEEVAGMKDKIKGAWLLWPGRSEGFARDGRRDTKMGPLVLALVEAGALGTIQSSPAEPFRIMDGGVAFWDGLPVLPDIKLLDKQYDEIKALVEKGKNVELQFEIRNWFKMGPVPYHNVIAVLEGREKPDEYVVIGGHLDSFDGGTGAVDDGNGASSAIEAVRLLVKAGVKPRRSVMIVLFAAEEMGLWGSQHVVKNHPEWNEKMSFAMARDGSPHAITGISVPLNWHADFERFTAPLKNLNPKFPFTLVKSEFPNIRPENPGGTDLTVYSQYGIPVFVGAGRSEYNNHNYQHIWHTLSDTYDDVLRFAEHQQHAAICQAVIAYGVAELPNLLNRENFYLKDGLYADINFGTMESPKRVLIRLDTAGAPEQVAHFLAATEGKGELQRGPWGPRGGNQPQTQGASGQPRPSSSRPVFFLQPQAQGAQERPPLATIVSAKAKFFEAKFRETLAHSANVPKIANKNLKSGKGLLGFAPDGFAVVARPKAELPNKYTPIGSIVATTDGFETLKPADPIRFLRIIRVGDEAKAFKAATLERVL